MSTTTENGTSVHLPFDEDLCERYLFGELSEAEQEQFEIAYFSDDAFFDRFLAVKDEILDLYSRNELDQSKRRRMEPHFLSTRPRQKRLADSREFIESISLVAARSAEPSFNRAAEPKPPGILDAVRRIFSPLRLAAAGGLVIAVAIGLWIFTKQDPPENVASTTGQPPEAAESPSGPEPSAETAGADRNSRPLIEPGNDPDSPSKPAEREVAVNAERLTPGNAAAPVPSPSATPSSAQMAHGDPPKPPANDVRIPVPESPKQPDPGRELVGARTETVTLDSASRSVTRRNTARIGTATQNVVVRMVFGGEAYSSYTVRISGVGGSTIWRASNLKTGMSEGTKSLAVTVPAGALSRRDYIVVLEGRTANGASETIREYYLHVDRE